MEKLKLNIFNTDNDEYVPVQIFYDKDKFFFSEDDGVITMMSKGLKYGSVKIKETKEELIKQVKSINIIS